MFDTHYTEPRFFSIDQLRAWIAFLENETPMPNSYIPSCMTVENLPLLIQTLNKKNQMRKKQKKLMTQVIKKAQQALDNPEQTADLEKLIDSLDGFICVAKTFERDHTFALGEEYKSLREQMRHLQNQLKSQY